ncbi:hypothetical protein [Halomarina pelagica]|uniref:hypothetical protein n=1 Tax=Halomarina pelagica TaxID=2961599 RepID=UPI0020C2106C|nr:hypothetical protein [Halomarina sp. BND7]
MSAASAAGETGGSDPRAARVRRVRLLVRTEIVRRTRSMRGRRGQLLALAVAALFGGLVFVGGVAGVYVFAGAVAAGEAEVPMRIVRFVVTGLFGFAAFITALRAVQQTANPPNLDGLLTAVPHREVVAGTLLVEFLVALLLPGLPAFGMAVAFGVGASAPLAAALLLATVVALVALGVLVGFALGLLVRLAIARSETLSRYRTPVAVALFLAYFATVTSGDSASAFEPILDVVAATPLGWFADLGFYGTVAGASALRAGGAVAATALAVPTLGWACGRLAEALWYDDPVQPETRSEGSSGMGDVAGIPRPVARIARKSWLRARRNPLRLQYVVYPLFFLWAPLSQGLTSGEVPPELAAIVAFYGAWATGAAFSLNPVGDEGPVLPVTLTTPVTGRTFVAGVCLAGALVGVPLTALLAVGLGVAGGLGAVGLLAVAVTAVVLPLAATGIATGAGTLFPRLGTVRLSRSREAVVPSLFAFAAYSLVLSLAGLPALVASAPVARAVLSELLGVGSTAILAAGLALAAVLGCVAAAVGVRVAVRGFEGYTYD